MAQAQGPLLSIEKELSCSICTEILYQPLTILDCLHTFCGSCLKEWFDHVALKARTAPSSLPVDATIFSCPACRAPVRDTVHNATVFTLLEMYLSANPDKARSESEKEEIAAKYKPGQSILPMLDDFLDHNGLESSYDSRGPFAAPIPYRNRSRERPSAPPAQAEDRNTRERRRRRHDEEQPGDVREQRRLEHQASLRTLIWESGLSQREFELEISELVRQIEADGLLDDVDLDSIDLNGHDDLIQRITEVYRRRRSEREQTRRREQARNSDREQDRPRIGQRSSGISATRPQLPGPSASSSSSAAVLHYNAQPNARHRSYEYSRSASAGRTHARSVGGLDDMPDPRQRPSAAAGGISESNHLDIPAPRERTRRRSGSSVLYTPLCAHESSFDAGHTQHLGSSAPSDTAQLNVRGRRALASSNGSVSVSPLTEAVSPVSLPLLDSPTSPAGMLSFASRTLAAGAPIAVNPTPRPPTLAQTASASRPANVRTIAKPQTLLNATIPQIRCSNCRKGSIEFELHYNCYLCERGEWNLCLDCYRSGKGCLGWRSFRAAVKARYNWEKELDSAKRPSTDALPEAKAHFLMPTRFISTASPTERGRIKAERGNFCASCSGWANDCWWWCDVCNQGDWGFCNSCVDKGLSCTHPLLPISYYRPGTASMTMLTNNTHTTGMLAEIAAIGPPPKRASLVDPSSTTGGEMLGGCNQLIFNTMCSLCQGSIWPEQERYHCFICAQTQTHTPDALPDEFEICSGCYDRMEQRKRISAENGASGWRRCPKGHRMEVYAFTDGPLGKYRTVLSGLVGGRLLRVTPAAALTSGLAGPASGKEVAASNGSASAETWTWVGENGRLRGRLVMGVHATTITTTAAAATAAVGLGEFPAPGGAGGRAVAKWHWWGRGDDVLNFPRGAEIAELEDVNGEWCFGCYMGRQGIFPAAFVTLVAGRAIRVVKDEAEAGTAAETEAGMGLDRVNITA